MTRPARQRFSSRSHFPAFLEPRRLAETAVVQEACVHGVSRRRRAHRRWALRLGREAPPCIISREPEASPVVNQTSRTATWYKPMVVSS